MCAAAELQMHRVFIKSLWFAGGKHTFGALAASLLVHASPLIELHGVLRYMVTCLQSSGIELEMGIPSWILLWWYSGLKPHRHWILVPRTLSYLSKSREGGGLVEV